MTSAEYRAILAGEKAKHKSTSKKPPLADQLFFKLLEEYKLPLPEKEFKFHSTRQWRADYAWPGHMLLLEVEGGVWTQGRHTRGKGAIEDMAKYNSAVSMGYRLLRVTPDQLCTAETCRLIKICLNFIYSTK